MNRLHFYKLFTDIESINELNVGIRFQNITELNTEQWNYLFSLLDARKKEENIIQCNIILNYFLNNKCIVPNIFNNIYIFNLSTLKICYSYNVNVPIYYWMNTLKLKRIRFDMIDDILPILFQLDNVRVYVTFIDMLDLKVKEMDTLFTNTLFKQYVIDNYYDILNQLQTDNIVFHNIVIKYYSGVFTSNMILKYNSFDEFSKRTRKKIAERYNKKFDVYAFQHFTNIDDPYYFPEIISKIDVEYNLNLLKQMQNINSFNYVLSRLDKNIIFTNNDILGLKLDLELDQDIINRYADTPTIEFLKGIDTHPKYILLKNYIYKNLVYLADPDISIKNNYYIIQALTNINDITFIIKRCLNIVLQPYNGLELGMVIFRHFKGESLNIYMTDSPPYKFIKNINCLE